MDELDILKKDWQKGKYTYTEVSEQDIYGMLHKKSSSIVKWILIISILELSFWITLNILFSNEDTLKFDSMKWKTVLDVGTYINYAITVVFIFIFYKNYIKISTTVSTRILMSNILRTRKTIQYYVGYNLGMIALSFMYLFFVTIFHNLDKDIIPLKNMLLDGNHLFLSGLCILILVVITAAFVALFWLFYKLLYGILMKKLLANYKELKKIDL